MKYFLISAFIFLVYAQARHALISWKKKPKSKRSSWTTYCPWNVSPPALPPPPPVRVKPSEIHVRPPGKMVETRGSYVPTAAQVQLPPVYPVSVKPLKIRGLKAPDRSLQSHE